LFDHLIDDQEHPCGRGDRAEIQALSAHDRHKLRIKIKKIRYAIEFFESLHEGHEHKQLARLSKRLKGLQDALGSLNDLAAHCAMASDAALRAPRAHRRARAFAAGVILGQEEEAAKTLLKHAAKAIRQLGSTP
jgi:CHAD domain-containing protein